MEAKFMQRKGSIFNSTIVGLFWKLYILLLFAISERSSGLNYAANGWQIHQFNLNDRLDVVSSFLSSENITISDLPYVAKAKTRIRYNTESSAFEFVRSPLEGYYRFHKVMYTRTDDACFHDENSEAAAPFGIAAIADWAITNFSGRLGIFGSTLSPQIIYVQERALTEFVNTVLPHLTTPFVLLSAVNDHTIPVNYDLRFGYGSSNWYFWNKLMESPLLLHWFGENLSVHNNRTSTLPIGTWLPALAEYPKQLPFSLPFQNKTMKFLVTDKVHNKHPQFQDRINVANICLTIPHNCYHIRQQDAERNSEDLYGLSNVDIWMKMVQQFTFQLCVHGGGFDPSTKAWETMILGTIPIIEHSFVDDAYTQLPVAYVKNMTEFALMDKDVQSQMMMRWVNKLGPYYTANTPEHAILEERLQIFYWFQQMIKHFNIVHPEHHAKQSSQAHVYRFGYLQGLPPKLIWKFWEKYSKNDLIVSKLAARKQ